MLRAIQPFVGGQISRSLAAILILAGIFNSSETWAQQREYSGLIRSKVPDRGSYRAPQVKQAERTTSGPSEDAATESESATESGSLATLVRGDQAMSTEPIGQVAFQNEPTVVRPKVRRVTHQSDHWTLASHCLTRLVSKARLPKLALCMNHLAVGSLAADWNLAAAVNFLATLATVHVVEPRQVATVSVAAPTNHAAVDRWAVIVAALACALILANGLVRSKY